MSKEHADQWAIHLAKQDADKASREALDAALARRADPEREQRQRMLDAYRDHGAELRAQWEQLRTVNPMQAAQFLDAHATAIAYATARDRMDAEAAAANTDPPPDAA